MFKQIVVGYDGTDRANRAVQEAGDMATALGSALHLVTAIPKDEIHHFGVGSDQQVLSDVELAELELSKVASEFPHLRVSTIARTGPPARVLVDEAAQVQADIIVVGNKHVQGLGRVLGSVAEDVAQKAPCGVFISKTG